MITVKCYDQEWDCDIEFQSYRNGQLKIILVGADTEKNLENEVFPGVPIGTATTCINEHTFNKNETAIKAYDEGYAFYKALLDAGLVKGKGVIEKDFGHYQVKFNVVEVVH